MTHRDQAREALLSAALMYVAGRLHRECSEPHAHDDAQAELDQEILDEGVKIYYEALVMS